MERAFGGTVQTTARLCVRIPDLAAGVELTASIGRQPERVLPAVVDELGQRLGDKPECSSPTASASPTANSPGACGSIPLKARPGWARAM